MKRSDRKSDRKKKKSTRKHKSELVAPECSENCQINHTIEQTAALLQCSTDTVIRMLKRGTLPHIKCGAGLKHKSRRIPHSAIRQLVGTEQLSLFA